MKRKEQKPTVPRAAAFTLIEVMIVVLIIGVLVAIAMPVFIQARENSRAKACISNLTKIDTAKAQWIMDHNTNTFSPVSSSLDTSLGGIVPIYVRTTPVCPSNGVYNTGDYTSVPTCSIGASASVPHVMT